MHDTKIFNWNTISDLSIEHQTYGFRFLDFNYKNGSTKLYASVCNGIIIAINYLILTFNDQNVCICGNLMLI